METIRPLTYGPNIISAIRTDKDFKGVKLPKVYEKSP
jgi:hypothetical protein